VDCRAVFVVCAVCKFVWIYCEHFMSSEKKVIIIIGKRGSGKSYLAYKLIEKEQRLVVFDIMSEYENGVIFDGEDYECFLTFWRRVYRGSFRLIYRPLNPDAEIDRICELVFKAGNLCFLVEEIDCYCSSHRISDFFASVIQRGRHKHITLIGVTQRPYGIHLLLKSQAKEAYIFNTNEPRDREYLRTWLGQEIESKLDSLQLYQYVHWQDGIEGLEIGKA